jgi:hypothetical protein
MTKRSWVAIATTVGAASLTTPAPASAQADPRDQNVALAYEGFTKNDDGTYDLWFGYFNRNWDREFDVPIGPDNSIEPRGPDGGQPTHFFPRRSQFVFSVRVAATSRRTTRWCGRSPRTASRSAPMVRSDPSTRSTTS